MALLVFLPSHRMRQRLRNSSARAYVFPLLHSTVSIVVLGRLISTFPCPANAVLDIGPLRMLASVFGLMGVDWFLSMTSVLIFENVLDSVEHQTTQDCSRSSRSASLRRRVSHLVCAHLAALLVLGGLLTRSASFWQIPTAQQLATPASSSAPPSIAVSCLLNQRGKQIDDKEDWKWLLDQTAIRVAAGDDIILYDPCTSFYVLYWYKRTNSDAAHPHQVVRGGGSTLLRGGGGADSRPCKRLDP